MFVDPFELAEAAKFGGNVTRVVSRHAVDLEVFFFACFFGLFFWLVFLASFFPVTRTPDRLASCHRVFVRKCFLGGAK